MVPVKFLPPVFSRSSRSGNTPIAFSAFLSQSDTKRAFESIIVYESLTLRDLLQFIYFMSKGDGLKSFGGDLRSVQKVTNTVSPATTYKSLLSSVSQ